MEESGKRIESLSPAKRALLELRLKRQRAQGSSSAIPRRAIRDSARVSFAQQRLWFLDQLEPGQSSYNVPRAIRLKGVLDLDSLQRTLNELVARHEPLRTHFSAGDGSLRQIISDPAPIDLPVIDLRALADEEREARASLLASEDAMRSFDLEHGPVLRPSLLRLSDDAHILLLTTHHIVSDAWSAAILFRELGALYNAFANGQSSSLTPLPVQYADYAEWQRDWLQGAVLEEQLSYWKQQLAGVSGVLELPTDHARPATQTTRGAYESLSLSEELSEGLNELSRREGATLFMTLLAAFQVLLSRYTGQEDIVVGSPIAGRNHAETEGLIGFFVNTLALRTNLAGNPTFNELLGQVKETCVGAYAHQDLPFEKLVEELQPERDLNRNPFFQVMFQFQNTAREPLQLKGLAADLVEVVTETSKFDLMLAARDQAGALVLVIEYKTELFEPETIERLLRQFVTLLAGIIANPNERLGSLPLMTEAEQREVLVEWNATTAAFPRDQTIQQLFEEQAALTPEATVQCETAELTYRELNQRANQLAHYLRRRGVGPEVRVAICIERSMDVLSGLLGILKAGGAYVPLEPTSPPDRLAFILEDSQAHLLLTDSHLVKLFSTARVPVVALDGDWPAIAGESQANPAPNSSAEIAAHIIYTSGSTGKPKGVVSAHRASLNRFAWMWREYPFLRDEVCCQKTSLSFVDSIWEIFGPLLKGVPLVIIPDEEVKDAERFVAALARAKVTRLVLVPSLLRVMLEFGPGLSERLADLRYCICSGETLPLELAQQFRNQLPHVKLINLYGSSEVAADVTCYEIGGVTGRDHVPIGRPIANTSIYVLDRNFAPAPTGVPGEVFIGGEGLARGYFDRPELTAERFIPNPFSAARGARLFRSGDLGRFLPDGNIEYRGRRDHQVKIRGFRIELGEIEVTLKAQPKVADAVVLALDNEAGDKRLVAYVVAEGSLPALDELRAQLREKLPEYMIPTAFVVLDALPLTASGKVNRLALPPPALDQFETREGRVTPRTETEEVLAGIWAEVLGVGAVGVTQDFFSLGGHSLLFARVAARVRESFQVEVPLRTFFETPTVAGIARRIDERRQANEDSETPLAAVSRQKSLPLSFAQERLWFFDQLEPGSAAYNLARAQRLRGPLDLNVLQMSFAAILARHEVLQTRFLTDNGRPVLSSSTAEMVDVPLVELSHLPIGEREEQALLLVNRETERPFDLKNEPAVRLAVLRLDHEEHVLVLTMHHIVSDAWSIAIFLRELVSLYNAFITGGAPVLPELPIQYADFAAWQRQRPLEKQLEFWRSQLRGAPPLIDLPTDRPRPAARGFRGAKHQVTIAKEIAGGLKIVARSERATLFMTLLTAFEILLACLNDQNDIVVGSPIAGRNRLETENLIGYFANTLLFRAKLAGDPSFRQTLAQTREAALGAYANQDVPFERLVDELQPERVLSHNPLFQVWFVLQNAAVERPRWHGLEAQSFDIQSTTTRHDLQLTLWETENGLEGAFTYATELFESDTIGCINEQFTALLKIVVDQPDIQLTQVRALLNDVRSEHRRRLAQHSEQISRQKLKSAKRRAVSETRNA